MTDGPVPFRGTSQGADNVFGAFTCSVAGTSSFIGPAEPPAADTTGVCDPESAFIGLYGSYNYSRTDCQYDDTGQAFTVDLPGTVVACIPFSCFAAAADNGRGHRVLSFHSRVYVSRLLYSDGDVGRWDVDQ